MPAVDAALLVDASKIDLVITERLLTATRFTRTVHAVTSLPEALQFLVDNALVGDLLPEIIFIDSKMMVNDTTGFMDHFNNLASDLGRVPKLALCGVAINHPGVQALLKQPHVVGFLQKPLTPVALREFMLAKVGQRNVVKKASFAW